MHTKARIIDITGAGFAPRAETRCPLPKPTSTKQQSENHRSSPDGAPAQSCAEAQHLTVAQPTSYETEAPNVARVAMGLQRKRRFSFASHMEHAAPKHLAFHRRTNHDCVSEDTYPRPAASRPSVNPAFKALLHTKVRHTLVSGLDRPTVRSSLGLHTLQGSLPRCGGTTFIMPPLMGFARMHASALPSVPPGSHPQQSRLVFEKTAAPPGLSRLVDITNV